MYSSQLYTNLGFSNTSLHWVKHQAPRACHFLLLCSSGVSIQNNLTQDRQSWSLQGLEMLLAGCYCVPHGLFKVMEAGKGKLVISNQGGFCHFPYHFPALTKVKHHRLETKSSTCKEAQKLGKGRWLAREVQGQVSVILLVPFHKSWHLVQWILEEPMSVYCMAKQMNERKENSILPSSIPQHHSLWLGKSWPPSSAGLLTAVWEREDSFCL